MRQATSRPPSKPVHPRLRQAPQGFRKVRWIIDRSESSLCGGNATRLRVNSHPLAVMSRCAQARLAQINAPAQAQETSRGMQINFEQAGDQHRWPRIGSSDAARRCHLHDGCIQSRKRSPTAAAGCAGGWRLLQQRLSAVHLRPLCRRAGALSSGAGRVESASSTTERLIARVGVTAPPIF
jgi:hypothetical protein